MSETRKIRTKMRPHETIEVGPAEYLDLSRQGLIHEEVQEQAAPAPEVSAPGTERQTIITDVPAEATEPEVTPERKVRNRRTTTPGEPEPPRNQKEV
jgi:hypothetical protein